MSIETNHSLSVDCVIFGFNGTELKVLVIDSKESEQFKKLPGSMIMENETLPAAAQRILSKTTGLNDIYLKQTSIYSDPSRVEPADLKWINRNHGVECNRVVTVGYYALVKLDNHTIKHTTGSGTHWSSIDNIGQLMMDHNKILNESLKLLKTEIVNSPIAFELLPKSFTIRALQDLYSAVLGIEIDKRNFRRKLLNSGLLTQTGKFESGVAHKPAEFYTFNHNEYNKRLKRGLRLAFL